MGSSSRERFLICLLILSVIWAVSYVAFIKPGDASYGLTRQKLNSLAEDRRQMELYLSRYEDLERQLDEVQKEEGAGQLFFQDIDDAYMDRDLQAKAAKAGVTIGRMSIGGAEYVEGPDRPEEDQTGSEEPTGEEPQPGPHIWETVITMEMESPDGEGIMAFAEEIGREQKSLTVSFLDVASVYETGDDGQKIYQGMKGIVEVRYYYEETR